MLVFTGGRESEGNVKDSICLPMKKDMNLPSQLQKKINEVEIFEHLNNIDLNTNEGEGASEESKIVLTDITSQTDALPVILEMLGCRLFTLSTENLADLENLWDAW